jgi:integrase
MASLRKRGDTWEARVRRQGFRTVGKSFKTKAEAERWVSVIESEMVRNEYADRRVLERKTLGCLLKRYLEEVCPSKKGDQEFYIIMKLMKHPLAMRSLASLKTADFSAYVAERLKSVKPKTVLNELSSLGAMYNLAIKSWSIEGLVNPITNVKKPSAGKGRERRLEPSEEQVLFDELSKPCHNPFLRPALELLIETAMRRGELVKLLWANVDLVGRTAKLLDTKNGDDRVVPLTPRALAILHDLKSRAETDHVIPMTGNAMRLAFARVRQKLKIEDLRIHDLRHEGTTRLFEVHGLNVIEAAAVTGHKDLKMLKRYSHVRASHVAEKMAKTG